MQNSFDAFDHLPESIVKSNILKKEHLLQLIENGVPSINPAFDDSQLKAIYQYYGTQPEEMEQEIHKYALHLLEKGCIENAWQVLLAADLF